MLSRNSYPQGYIDECRARVKADVATFNELVAAAKKAGKPALDSTVASFEPVFFNNMVIVLDSAFTHRSRTMEGKDGNPLNEVRVLCNSLMENGGSLAADKSITLKPATSVLHHEVGDEIHLSEDDFVRLSDAFFAEIEAKFA